MQVFVVTILDSTMIVYHSPCIGECELKDNTCIGCGRTIDEITQWLDMTNEQRLEIYERCKRDKTNSI